MLDLQGRLTANSIAQNTVGTIVSDLERVRAELKKAWFTNYSYYAQMLEEEQLLSLLIPWRPSQGLTTTIVREQDPRY